MTLFRSKPKRRFPHQEWDSSWVIYESDVLLVVNKPAGLATQPTVDPDKPSLFNHLKKIYPYIGLHHRLDQDTSGLIAFTKKKEANKSVSEQFLNRTVQKKYLAQVGCTKKIQLPAKVFSRKSYLKKSDHKKMVEVRSGGDSAETYFKWIEVARDQSSALVLAMPKTGRMHQIRVHLSVMGFPILGDPLYGHNFQNAAPRGLLHAHRLDIVEPLSEKELKLEAPLPKDFLECLNAYGLGSSNLLKNIPDISLSEFQR